MQDQQGTPISHNAGDEWITADELSKRLGVSKSTIYRAARANKIGSKKEGTKRYFQHSQATAVALAPKRKLSDASSLFPRFLGKVHNHPWFTLLAGLSSILGLAIAIYTIWPGTSSSLRVQSGNGNNSSSQVQSSPTPTLPEAVSGELDESTAVGYAYKAPLGSYMPGKYRVRYIVFPGESSYTDKKSPVFGLLNGSVKETTQDLFSREPYVLKTEPLEVLARLSRRYPEFYTIGRPIVTAPYAQSPNRVQRTFNEDPHYYIVTHKDYGPNVDEAGETVPSQYGVGLIGSDNVQHLAGNYREIPPPILDLIANNPEIPDIAMEDLMYSECGSAWSLEFLRRPFNMLVLDIENLDSQPLEITSVKGRIYRFSDLHLYPWDDAPEGGAEEQYDFPIRVLAPGEHILVPMRLILASFGDYSHTMHPETLHPESLPATIPATTIPNVSLDYGADFDLHAPDKERSSQVHNEYILGTSFEPTLVEGMGAIRRFSRQHLVYHGRMLMGSCPFAFVFDNQLMRWENVGALIPNRDGKDKEGKDSLLIRYPYNGTLLIKELENETSFLDQVYLRVDTWDGRTLTIYPDNQSLLRNDSSYVILRRGDQMLIKFTNLPINVRKTHLVSRGYFLREP